ncbi:MAG: restriction endonuclease subunit S [Clostridiales bacterium]|nr:restriction endonuclease subunit S [Clostridiales bacterium]
MKVKLGEFIKEFSKKNKGNYPYPVYSVTNSNGFCTEYFTKDVSSEDKRTYKIVPYGFFAYNPSRINVGSVDCQLKEENVIVSPLYTVFSCSKDLDQEYLNYFFKSNYGKRLIKQRVSGSVRFNLKFDVLCDFEIANRIVEEQKAAVKVFKNIERMISIETKQLALLDELIKSRFIYPMEAQLCC